MYWNKNLKTNKDTGNQWLIETWDVLKLDKINKFNLNFRRLIETWDVLKSLTRQR